MCCRRMGFERRSNDRQSPSRSIPQARDLVREVLLPLSHCSLPPALSHASQKQLFGDYEAYQHQNS